MYRRMGTADERGGAANGEEKYTEDGSVDLKGRPVLRSKTGRWRACSFIVGYEVLERAAYHGIASNLVMYMTLKLHQGTVKSSNNVTNWAGVVWMTPILGAYIADAYLGRFWTFIISSSIYFLGLCLLTMSVTLPSLKPPQCGPEVKEGECKLQASSFQLAFFFFALYTIAVGNGGTKPNISSIGADQFDDHEPKEKKQKQSFFNWWMCSVFVGSLLANTVMVFVQDNVGFTTGYGLQTIGVAVAMILFLIGIPFYRHKKPAGSSLVRMARVIVAAMRKWRVRFPDDPKELHELSIEEYVNSGKVRIDNSPALRFLDKAAVKTGSSSPWMLCPVTQVEEAKQMLKMFPVFIATLFPGMMFAQVQTLFIKQASTLDRHLGGILVPPASLKAFIPLAMLTSMFIYERCFLPWMRRRTNNPRGITMLLRMGIGISIYIIVMATASLVEKRRLSVIREKDIGPRDMVPLRVFILVPQYALMGIADTFLEAAKLEFFYDQAPESMKSLATSYYTTGLGLGSFLSSMTLGLVSTFTKTNGSQGWIQDSLNTSRLDNYYIMMALVSFLNLVYFIIVAKNYVYNADTTEYNKDLAMTALDKGESPRSEEAR